MTEQLYRWVKSSERLPEDRVITRWNHGGDPEQERIDILGKEQILSFTSPSEIESIEWLEPYTPPLVSAHDQILQLLITGGFLDPGKLKEARDIIGKCAQSKVIGESIGELIDVGYSTAIKEAMHIVAKNIIPHHSVVTPIINNILKELEALKGKYPPAPSPVSGSLEDAAEEHPDDRTQLKIGRLEINCFDEDSEMSLRIGNSKYESLTMNEVKELSYFIASHIKNEEGAANSPSEQITLEQKAKEYADKVYPFVWPLNKKGEPITQLVGQSAAPGSAKHRKEQRKFIDAFLAGASHSFNKESFLQELRDENPYENWPHKRVWNQCVDEATKILNQKEDK